MCLRVSEGEGERERGVRVRIHEKSSNQIKRDY